MTATNAQARKRITRLHADAVANRKRLAAKLAAAATRLEEAPALTDAKPIGAIVIDLEAAAKEEGIYYAGLSQIDRTDAAVDGETIDYWADTYGTHGAAGHVHAAMSLTSDDLYERDYLASYGL